MYEYTRILPLLEIFPHHAANAEEVKLWQSISISALSALSALSSALRGTFEASALPYSCFALVLLPSPIHTVVRPRNTVIIGELNCRLSLWHKF